MKNILERLSELGLNEEQIKEWLDVKILVLDNHSPQELIDEGKEEIVINLIEEMKSGFCV